MGLWKWWGNWFGTGDWMEREIRTVAVRTVVRKEIEYEVWAI